MVNLPKSSMKKNIWGNKGTIAFFKQKFLSRIDMRLPLNERYIKYCGEHGIDKRYFESAKEYFMKYGTAGEAANAAFKHIHDVYSKGEVWYTDSQITARTNARNHSNMVERFYKLFLKDPQMVRLKATGGKE